MAIPEHEREFLEQVLSHFCASCVPDHAKHQVELLHQKRGDALTLIERRPYFRDPSMHTETPIARFRYLTKESCWALDWPDSNGRWHPYTGLGRERHFLRLLQEVGSDPTRIFWG